MSRAHGALLQVTDLTVVVPAYNEAAALPALLDDLRRQQGIALEVVVADGGSSDNTPALAVAGGASGLVPARRSFS